MTAKRESLKKFPRILSTSKIIKEAGAKSYDSYSFDDITAKRKKLVKFPHTQSASRITQEACGKPYVSCKALYFTLRVEKRALMLSEVMLRSREARPWSGRSGSRMNMDTRLATKGSSRIRTSSSADDPSGSFKRPTIIGISNLRENHDVYICWKLYCRVIGKVLFSWNTHE